jgi:hypothetical protein
MNFSDILKLVGLLLVGMILFSSRTYPWKLFLVFGITLGIVILARKYIGGFLRVW